MMLYRYGSDLKILNATSLTRSTDLRSTSFVTGSSTSCGRNRRDKASSDRTAELRHKKKHSYQWVELLTQVSHATWPPSRDEHITR
ncbi:hypothetical protein C6341_g15382 [Phytophthora cactorum]|nr:hypothetical protein C6341_g15382 [Phytophthora cactorum]